MKTWLTRLYQRLLQVETFILVSLLLSMIVIAVLQIILRNFFGGGILWVDAYLRIAVLWIALFGAMIAGRTTRHIAIDIVLQKLPGLWQQRMRRLAFVITAAICATMTWFSAQFVWQEREFGDVAFAEIPAWWCESIIPLAFGVIALRYLLAALLNATQSDKEFV